MEEAKPVICSWNWPSSKHAATNQRTHCDVDVKMKASVMFVYHEEKWTLEMTLPPLRPLTPISFLPPLFSGPCSQPVRVHVWSDVLWPIFWTPLCLADGFLFIVPVGRNRWTQAGTWGSHQETMTSLKSLPNFFWCDHKLLSMFGAPVLVLCPTNCCSFVHTTTEPCQASNLSQCLTAPFCVEGETNSVLFFSF